MDKITMIKAEYKANLLKILNSERDIIQEKTLSYWKLIQCWNGVDNSKLTIGGAFTQINNIQSNINPQRPLNNRLNTLRDNIISFGSKEKLERYQKRQKAKNKNNPTASEIETKTSIYIM